MLSALMVHIYHLHTAMPSEVTAQREGILHCMDALERLSELWLVGKMVRDLFATVLAFDGFDFRVKHTSPDDNNQKLTGMMESDLEGLNVTDGSTPDPQNADKSLRALPLTPSLVAHMDAALKSATTQFHSGRLSVSRSASESVLLPGTTDYIEEQWQCLRRSLAPRSRSEYHGVHHNPFWLDDQLSSTPESTGLNNAAEWFVSLLYASFHGSDFLQVPVFRNSMKI
jgi:hypothetical protein